MDASENIPASSAQVPSQNIKKLTLVIGQPAQNSDHAPSSSCPATPPAFPSSSPPNTPTTPIPCIILTRPHVSQRGVNPVREEYPESAAVPLLSSGDPGNSDPVSSNVAIPSSPSPSSHSTASSSVIPAQGDTGAVRGGSQKRYRRRSRKISWRDEGDSDSGSVTRFSRDELYLLDPNTTVVPPLNLDDPLLDETVNLPAELPPAPDGGWGWMIVAVSFICNMVVDGTAYSFSPFLPIFSAYFDEPQGKVAWISSLLAGVYLSAGPVVSALTNKFGCRPVCIVGALVSSAAFLITPFANSVGYLMITQGLIGGFGFGLIYLPAVVCVGYYFEKKRALATGIAVCGSGVGTFIFPPLVKYLIGVYTWKGTNIILAGIILNCAWCGALMRPLTAPRMTKRELLQRLEKEEKELKASLSKTGSSFIYSGRRSNGDPGVQSHLSLSINTSVLPTIKEGTPQKQEADSAVDTSPSADEKDALVGSRKTSSPAAMVTTSERMARNSSQPSMMLQPPRKRTLPGVGSVPNFERRRSRSELVNQLKVIPGTPKSSTLTLNEPKYSTASDTSGLRQRRVSTDSRKGVMLRPMSRGDIFYSGSIANLQEFKSQQSLHSYRESTLNFQCVGGSKLVLDVLDSQAQSAGVELPPVFQEEKKESCSCIPESMRGTLKEMLDFSLLRDPVFLLVGVANVFGMLGFYTPYVYLPGAAVEKGIEPEAATYLISIIGITNTIGRVLSGVIADIPKVSALQINNFCVLMSGLCVFLTPFATSYGAFVTLAIFFGFFVSPYVSLTSIILVDLLGLQQLTNAFGLLILFRGAASMVGPPIAGSIYDSTKSYDISFYVAGILLFACAALHYMVPCVQRYCDRRNITFQTNEDIDNEEFGCSDGGGGGGGGGGGPDEPTDGEGIIIDIGPKQREERAPSIGGLKKINEGIPV